MAYWLWVHHSQQIHHLWSAKRSWGARGQESQLTHSHHDKAKLPSQMLMESHCIYLGRARAGAWTKTSQDQSDSTTERLQTALLCYPAAVRTVRVCQDLRAWKQICACLKQNWALPETGADVKHFGQVISVTKAGIRYMGLISLKC